MSRAGRVLRRSAGALAAVPAVLAGLSMRDLAGALIVVVITVAALCWVIKDAARSERLAMLIGAWRGPTPGAARCALLETASARRRADRATAAGSDPIPPAGTV